jgi:hypothetical protein
MSDRPKSIPADPEETAGFRETTLYLFKPRDAAALRHVGRLLHNLTLEADPFFGAAGESTIRRELEAALADASHLRDFLHAIGQQIENSELAPGDAQLSLFAREMVTALDCVLDSMQEALR